MATLRDFQLARLALLDEEIGRLTKLAVQAHRRDHEALGDSWQREADALWNERDALARRLGVE